MRFRSTNNQSAVRGADCCKRPPGPSRSRHQRLSHSRKRRVSRAGPQARAGRDVRRDHAAVAVRRITGCAGEGGHSLGADQHVPRGLRRPAGGAPRNDNRGTSTCRPGRPHFVRIRSASQGWRNPLPWRPPLGSAHGGSIAPRATDAIDRLRAGNVA